MLNCASILMVHIFMLILLFSPKMLFASDDEYPNNLFSSSRKKNKSLLLCIHYVYLSLAGGRSVLRMNISHSIVYTMAPFIVPIWPPVCDRGTVISNPWNASCSFNEFNIQQRGKKKESYMCFWVHLFTFPPSSPPNNNHWSAHTLWKKRREALCLWNRTYKISSSTWP